MLKYPQIEGDNHPVTCSPPVQNCVSHHELCASAFILSLGCCSSEWPSRKILLDSQISMPLPLLCPSLLLDVARSLSQGYWSGKGENGISFVGIEFEDHLQDILGSLLMLSWKRLVCASLSLQINRIVRGALLLRILRPLTVSCIGESREAYVGQQVVGTQPDCG